MLRQTILFLSNQQQIFKFIRNTAMAKQFASRFVAGATGEGALAGAGR